MPTHLNDAFYRYEEKGNVGVYLFWSNDWMKFKPWTYDGEKINYFDKKVLDRKIGTMVTYFVGPLCVVKYKMRK